MADPFKVCRVSTVGEVGHVLDMIRSMTIESNVSVESRRKDGWCTIVKEDVRAAACASIAASNSMACLTDDAATSYMRAAIETPSRRPAIESTRVGTLETASMG